MSFWRRAPFLRIGIFLMAGMAAGHGMHPREEEAPLALAAAVVSAFAAAWLGGRRAFARRHHAGIAWCCFFFISGLVLAWLSWPGTDAAHFIRHPMGTPCVLRIHTSESTPSGSRGQAVVLAVQGAGGWQAASGTVAWRDTSARKDLYPGVALLATAGISSVRPPRWPCAFSYRKLLANQGIWGEVRLDRGQVTRLACWTQHTHATRLHAWRAHIRERITSGIADTGARAVLMALLMGDDQAIPRELSQAYAASGTIHVLAVSGLHVGLIYAILQAALGRIPALRRRPQLLTALQLMLLWTYAGLTGFSPSVQRAAVMFSFFLLARHIHRPGNGLNTLLASACLITACDPHILFSVGFHLSYLAVLGILLFQRPVGAWFVFRNPLLRHAWQLSAVSISAQITTLPVTLYLFDQFPVYFIFSNLLIIPLSTLLLYAGIAFLLMGWWPWAFRLLAMLLEHGVGLMNAIAREVTTLPGSTLQGFHLGMTGLVLLTACTALVSASLLLHRPRWLLHSLFILVIWTGLSLHASHNRGNRREYLVGESRGYPLVCSTEGLHTLCAFAQPEAGPEHALLPYLRHLRTAVSLIPMDTSAAWLVLHAPDRKSRAVVFTRQVNRLYLADSLLSRIPGDTWLLCSRISRYRRHLILQEARRRHIPCGLLRDGAWVAREKGWAPCSAIYP